MKASKLLIPTLKEVPADAEVISHQLLVRAGMIRRLAQGVYSYLPLGWRVMEKISRIVREEMDRCGCQEIMMPILQPAELWQESGRWMLYGQELVRLQDRHAKEFCLGPTHEEVVTDLARTFVSSYKQIPINVYQIQNKYRDERRPRFGLMRSREFLMKDGYSFDRDEQGLDRSYQEMHRAYCEVFRRVGLAYRAVEADSGTMGGSNTHEFMVMAETGEAGVVYCSRCEYAANTEKAKTWPEPPEETACPGLEKVSTPGCKTMEDVCGFLGVSRDRSIKAVLLRAVYGDREELAAAFLRGDREANPVKVQNELGAVAVEMDVTDQEAGAAGICKGFIGPVGLSGVTLLIDEEISRMRDLVCGANQEDAHFLHACYERDFREGRVCDIKTVGQGDKCPRCQAPLESARGIEVGQIFKLGTRYSESMGANYLDENGKSRPLVMGCYGIGIGRTMQACIEQNHDEKGIVWPRAIAPFEVVVLPANHKKEEEMAAARQIYDALRERGVDVLLDDSPERTGVKLANSELVGYPVRVLAGKLLAQGQVEVMVRRSGDTRAVAVGEAPDHVAGLLADL